MKKFADDQFEFDENDRNSISQKRVEKIVGKGGNACYKQFLLSPYCFQKTCFSFSHTVFKRIVLQTCKKQRLVWERVQSIKQNFTLVHIADDKIKWGKNVEENIVGKRQNVGY